MRKINTLLIGAIGAVIQSCGGDSSEMKVLCEDVPNWTITFNNPSASALIEDGFLKIIIPDPQSKDDVILRATQPNFHPVNPNRDTRDFAMSSQIQMQNLNIDASAEKLWIGMYLKYATVPDSAFLTMTRTSGGSTVAFAGHFNNRGSTANNGIFDFDLLIFDSDITYNIQNVANPLGLKFPKIKLPDPYLFEFEFGILPIAGGTEQENLEFWIYHVNFSDFQDIVQVSEMPDDDFNCNSIN